MASKGLSGAAPVLEGYGLSCEHDLSLLVQEDLNTLSSQLKLFHNRILRTWVQGLAAEDQCSRSTTNAISELLLICVCVCV